MASFSGVNAQSTLSSGMVLYLPFNGSMADMSGRGHNPTNFGCIPVAGKSGIPNTGYRFTGSSYMSIPHHPDLVPRKFSICTKVQLLGYYDGFCYNNVILAKGLDRDPGSYSIRTTETTLGDCSFQDTAAHNYRCDVQYISTTVGNMNTTPYIVEGNWDCVVGTYDGDSVRLYVNGVLRYKYEEPAFAINYDDMLLGRISSTTRPFFFNGVIDEIRMYNRVLSPAEVMEYCGLGAPVFNKMTAAFDYSTGSCLELNFKDKSTVTSTGIAIWQWDFGDGTTSTDKDPVHKFPATGTYPVKLKVIDSAGYTDSVTSPVVVTSSVHITAGPRDTLICGNAVFHLRASGGDSYVWSPATGLDDNTAPDPLVTVTQTRRYIVTGTKDGCVGADTVDITTRPVPVFTVDPDTASGCPGRQVTVTTTGAYSYRWFPPTGLSSDIIPSPVITIAGNITYQVQAIDASGCVAFDSITVTQYPAPFLDATSSAGTVDCLHGSVQLTATGADTYSWDPAFYCDQPNAATTKVHPPSNTVFTVTGSNAFGCQGNDTVSVVYEGSSIVQVPSVFTPNGDFLNDDIRPIIICDFKMTAFSIFSRWGNKLYEASDAGHSWDGTSNGVPCDGGIYFYMLKGKNGKGDDVLFKGNILLVR